MILAMENAGQLIEDEELRAQIKGSGIGTSATRAEILKKLFNIKYLALNKKTQVITPTLLGEMIFDVVNCSIRQLLNRSLRQAGKRGSPMWQRAASRNRNIWTSWSILCGYVPGRWRQAIISITCGSFLMWPL